jgi:hypothetical protein
LLITVLRLCYTPVTAAVTVWFVTRHKQGYVSDIGFRGIPRAYHLSPNTLYLLM